MIQRSLSKTTGKSRTQEARFVLTPHCCRNCCGRILMQTSPGVASGGGNPYYECATCGVGTCSMGTSSLCWCGAKGEYRCAEVKGAPERIAQALRMNGFSNASGQFVIGFYKENYKMVGIEEAAKALEQRLTGDENLLRVEFKKWDTPEYGDFGEIILIVKDLSVRTYVNTFLQNSVTVRLEN